MQTYARLPVTFSHGEGAYLWDLDQRRYLDALAGIAVCALGHAHPAITEAVSDQAGKLIHTSNLYGVELQQKLADKLCSLSNMQRAFFCNSGAEANEAAIKIARRYGNQHGKYKIITMHGSFHGRTLATLTATGNPKVKEGFQPLPDGFVHAAYDDIDAIKKLAESEPDICAVLVEPIQGEGGINILADGYLASLRDICDKHNWLLMIDEIQTGTGRCGQWFAFQYEAIQPDVVTVAKALGNGLPIGACLATGPAAETLQPGTHGTTFGGNPLAARVALTVIETIEKDKLVQHCQELGEYMLNQFKQQLLNNDNVVDIRGKGLMIGIELKQPCTELVKQALDKQILINVTAQNVIRLLPPYVINRDQADTIVETVCSLIKEHVQKISAH